MGWRGSSQLRPRRAASAVSGLSRSRRSPRTRARWLSRARFCGRREEERFSTAFQGATLGHLFGECPQVPSCDGGLLNGHLGGAQRAASASPSRCTSSATRRARDGMTRQRPESHRAVGQAALNTRTYTTHAPFVVAAAWGTAPPRRVRAGSKIRSDECLWRGNGRVRAPNTYERQQRSGNERRLPFSGDA
jgi:hypothetical protein